MTAAIVAFALGVWWLQQQAVLPAIPPMDVWLWTVPGAALFIVRPARPVLFTVAAFVLGFAWAAGCAHLRMSDRLAPELEGRDLVVTGVVASLPAIGENSVRFEYDVEAVAQEGLRLPRRIQLAWYQAEFPSAQSARPPADGLPLRVHPGERWRFSVRLKRPHGSVNPHGFDYEAWLLERGVGATGYVRPGGEERKLGRRDSFADRVEQWRETVRDRFLKVLGETTAAGVLAALAVGDQRAIDNEDWRLFSRTGVTHLMSISGLHVTLISGLVAAIVSFGWRRIPPLALRFPARKAAAAAATFAALAYTLLAGFGVPAQRTFFMVAVVAAALWSGRISSATRILALALLAVLIVDPWAVLAAGFWLSFGAVGLIFYLSQGWTAREAGPGVDAGRAGRFAFWLMQWGRVQWGITAGLAPATLLLFAQVSLVGPLANAVAIPAVSMVITPLALLCAAVPLDSLLQLTALLTEWLLDFLGWCDSLPLAQWQQAAPPVWSVLLAMGGVLWLLAPRGVPNRILGLVLFLPALLVPAPRPPPGEAWITTLDVGQGLAVLVRTAGHALLYDAGPTYGTESDSGQRIIAPYLRALGATQLDLMIITHNDADHSGGALSVMQSADIARFLSSLAHDNPIARAANDPGRCARGERWQWDGVEFALLHPAIADYADDSLKINNRSCVLRISAGRGSMLLTGDIEKKAEAMLLEREGAALRADVLLAPHHGSRTSSTAAFLAAVKPRVIIVPVGYRNRFGHPKADVLARYVASGAEVLRTDRDGAVHIVLGEPGAQAQFERAIRPRYWHAARL